MQVETLRTILGYVRTDRAIFTFGNRPTILRMGIVL